MSNLQKYSFMFLAIINLFITSCSEEKEVDKSIKLVEDTVELKADPLVQPVFENMNVKPKELIIDADSGKVFMAGLNNASEITVLPGSFIDSMGQVVNGKIKLTYRELRTTEEMLASGIPLSYDASGMLKRFKSTSLLEIHFSNERGKVFLDSGKTINVKLAMYDYFNGMHEFYLDELNERNWNYIKDLEGEDNPERKKIMRRALSKVNELKLPLSNQYFAFNYMALLDVYLNDKTVEIKKKRQDLTVQGKIKEYGVTWTNIFCFQQIDFQGTKTLASLLIWKKMNPEPWPAWGNNAVCDLTENNNGTYTVTLTEAKGKGKYKATVQPFMPIKSLLAFTPVYWKNKYNFAVKKAIQDEMKKNNVASNYLYLDVYRAGIYSVSALQTEEDYVQVNVHPIIEEPDFTNLKGANLYYISEQFKTVIRYPYNEWKNITLLPDKDAVLILVNKNKIAIVNKDEMSELDFNVLYKEEVKTLELSFSTIKSPLNDLSDLSKILGFARFR